MNFDPTTPPADPSTIRFGADCFVSDGERVYYVVANGCGLIDGTRNGGSARRHADRAAADARAVVIGGRVIERREPISRRVRWF